MFSEGHSALFAQDKEINSKMEGKLPLPTPVTNHLHKENSNRPSNHHFQYIQTLNQGFIPTKSALLAAIKSSTISLGKTIHAHVIKFGFQIDPFIATSIIAFYSKNGLLHFAHQAFEKIPEKDTPLQTSMLLAYVQSNNVVKARILFDEMHDKDVISWNAMITVYLRCGYANEALQLFQEMRCLNITPSEVTLICALSACSQLSCLELGRCIHTHIEKHSGFLACNITVNNSIIHMYSKCGKLDYAFKLFKNRDFKNLETWNTILTAYAIHGYGSESITLFAQMIKLGIVPDRITFLAILNACSHAGIVDHAQSCFSCMTRLYKINPEVKHYNCLVDVLCRKGYLNEACKLIKGMPFEVDAYALGALLSGCFVYKNYELGLNVAEQLVELDPHDEGRYVALCKVYEIVGRMDDAMKLRKVMVELGIKQKSGRSKIEIDGVVHEFIC